MIPEIIGIFNNFLEETSRIQKDKSIKPIQDKLESSISVAFKEQGKQFVKEFEKLKSKFQESGSESDDVNRILNAIFESTSAMMLNPLNVSIEDAIVSGGVDIIADIQFDYSFNLKNPRAQSYINKHGAEMVTRINEETRRQMNKLLSDAMNKGKSYDKIAAEIKDKWSRFAIGKPQHHIRSRAHLVAVTEVGNAYEFGNFEGISQLEDIGIKMEKHWNNSGDDRVSDGCKANTADGWIPKDQPHTSGHMHPLRFPGCRCWETYRRAAQQ